MKRLVLILIFFANTAFANPEIQRGPYLQKASANSIVIKWRTAQLRESTIRYGTSLTELSQEVTVKKKTTEHRVSITNLKPLTKYFYTIRSNKTSLTEPNAEVFFTTHPIANSAAPTRIWALADSGRANQGQIDVYNGYLKYIAKTKKQTNVWLTLGDNAYESGKDHEYQKGLFDVYQKTLNNTVLWPAFGNHDGYSANSKNLSGPYFEIFSLPRNAESGGTASNTEDYYSFDYGQIHFICLNSYDAGRSANGKMARWLRDDLKNTKLKWKIAYWHHPAYSKGYHDSDHEIEMVEMRENINPIIEEANVDLVLTGHSHSYERSKMINGHYGKSSSFKKSMVTDKNYNKKQKGTVYVVAGTGATIQEGKFDHPAIKVSKTQLGSLVIDVDKDTLTSNLIDVNGEVIDRFRVVKSR